MFFCVVCSLVLSSLINISYPHLSLKSPRVMLNHPEFCHNKLTLPYTTEVATIASHRLPEQMSFFRAFNDSQPGRHRLGIEEIDPSAWSLRELFNTFVQCDLKVHCALLITWYGWWQCQWCWRWFWRGWCRCWWWWRWWCWCWWFWGRDKWETDELVVMVDGSVGGLWNLPFIFLRINEN